MAKTDMKAPNVALHFYVSLAKSTIRIIAGICLMVGDFYVAGGLLVAAEVLGIAEEMV